MRCGTKCFQVEFEVNGEKQMKSVKARTPIEARKTIRSAIGEEVLILVVKEENKRRWIRIHINTQFFFEARITVYV